MRRPHLAILLLVGCDAPSGAASSASAKASAAPPPAASATATAAAPASAPAAPPTEVAAQHVLVAWKGAKNAPPGTKRTKAEAKKLADEVAEKARGGADFGELAKQHSDDPGSKERLGSVGKFTRDKMTKAFADAAFGLKVNEVSAPVESEFGYHVIKRNQ